MNKEMKYVDQLISNPKRLFLIDALGALLTAVSIGGILLPNHEHIGMPSRVLSALAICAVFFSAYSLCCHRLIQSNWKPFLGVIIVFNCLYGLVSLLLLYRHYESLTSLGLTYFILELLVIATVVFVEWKTYSSLK